MNNILKDCSNYCLKPEVNSALVAINESLGQQIKDRCTIKIFNAMKKDLEGKFFKLKSFTTEKFDILDIAQDDQDKEINALNIEVDTTQKELK